jgi:tetratricopeptide (TPR) repeat protein
MIDRFTRWLLVALMLTCPGTLLAHGPLHEQIAEVTARIAREPSNGELYLKRGELHRAHKEWTAALADYAIAERLNPALDAVDLCRGLALSGAGRPMRAKVAFDRFLARHPDHVRARVGRARALASLGQHSDAAADFTRAIAINTGAPPEYYLERAQLFVRAGRPAEALRSLDEGIATLGPLIALEAIAIELELDAGHFDAALSRLDRAWRGAARQDSWLLRRGEILERAGRHADARESYARALVALEALNPERRTASSVRTAEEHLRALLARGDRQNSLP